MLALRILQRGNEERCSFQSVLSPQQFDLSGNWMRDIDNYFNCVSSSEFLRFPFPIKSRMGYWLNMNRQSLLLFHFFVIVGNIDNFTLILILFSVEFAALIICLLLVYAYSSEFEHVFRSTSNSEHIIVQFADIV